MLSWCLLGLESPPSSYHPLACPSSHSRNQRPGLRKSAVPPMDLCNLLLCWHGRATTIRVGVRRFVELQVCRREGEACRRACQLDMQVCRFGLGGLTREEVDGRRRRQRYQSLQRDALHPPCTPPVSWVPVGPASLAFSLLHITRGELL